MASQRKVNAEKWIIRIESTLKSEDKKLIPNFTLNTLRNGLDHYNLIHINDHDVKAKTKQLILEASKRIIEKNQGKYAKALTRREGSRARLRGIASYADKLSNIIEPVLLHLDEVDYARKIVNDFMPKVEEAARYATRLDPVMAAQFLGIINSAESLGIVFNSGMREVFEEIIQLQITPKKPDSSRLLLDLAQERFDAGEYLTSYLLSREATRSVFKDLTSAYPRDLGPSTAPSPEWIFEDYLGYLKEVGLISDEQAEILEDLFVGEAEHLNCKWKKRGESEKALTAIRTYLEIMYIDNAVYGNWL